MIPTRPRWLPEHDRADRIMERVILVLALVIIYSLSIGWLR